MVKHKWITVAASVLAILACSSVAMAGSLKIAASSTDYKQLTFGGGEFVIYDYSGIQVGTISDAAWWDRNSDGVKNEFQTFCLERNEFLSSPALVDGEDKGATAGGYGSGAYAAWDVSGTSSYDPISLATAYLYTQFWTGQLSSYDYTPGAGRAADAKSLQMAIWCLEDEIAYFQLDAQSKAWITEAEGKIASGDWTDIGSVRVLNIYIKDAAGNIINKQSQLVLVPLPASAMMGLGLLCALGAYRGIRRRRNRI